MIARPAPESVGISVAVPQTTALAPLLAGTASVPSEVAWALFVKLPSRSTVTVTSQVEEAAVALFVTTTTRSVPAGTLTENGCVMLAPTSPTQFVPSLAGP